MIKSKSLQALIESFVKIPSIGQRMAERMALYVTRAQKDDIQMLIKSIQDVHHYVKKCKLCHHLAEENICSICSHAQRDKGKICVVEHSSDLLAIERTQSFKGVYHVLEGVFSPLDGVGPKDINVGSLMNRLKNNTSKEVIIATNPTANGEATARYVAKAVQSLNKPIKLYRIGFGVAVGSELSYVDKVTMTRSLELKTELV